MRRVGDESLLAGERGIEPLEHHVEGVGQLLELVIGAGEREALTEPQLGRPPRGLGDRPHRPQRPPGSEPAEAGRGDCEDPEANR